MKQTLAKIENKLRKKILRCLTCISCIAEQPCLKH